MLDFIRLLIRMSMSDRTGRLFSVSTAQALVLNAFDVSQLLEESCMACCTRVSCSVVCPTQRFYVGSASVKISKQIHGTGNAYSRVCWAFAALPTNMRRWLHATSVR